MKLGLSLAIVITIVSAAAAESPKERRCGRVSVTARSLKISGTKFAPFESYSVSNIEKLPCAKMPKRSNVPAALRSVTRTYFKKQSGVWILDGRYDFGVDPEDHHIYRYASLVYFGDDLAVPERNPGEPRVASAFPASKLPGEEPQLVEAAGTLFRNKKQVLRAAATTTWQPRRQRDGSNVEALVGTIAVLDPADQKCTLWEGMNFVRDPRRRKVELDVSSPTVSDIDCKKL
jgi:hypothetical protein